MSKKLEATAYHEAGHAVGYLAQFRRFNYVTIEPEENTLGRCVAVKPLPVAIQYDQSYRAKRRIEQEAIIAAAGNIAERFFTKMRIVVGSCSDYCSVFDLLSLHSGDTDEVSAYHALVAIRARNLLLHPFHWVIVEAIAEALLARRTLTYSQARAIAQLANNALLGNHDEQARLRKEAADYQRQYPFRPTDYFWREVTVPK
jgi:hypothetical protein